jgi:hypothetical protein
VFVSNPSACGTVAHLRVITDAALAKVLAERTAPVAPVVPVRATRNKPQQTRSAKPALLAKPIDFGVFYDVAKAAPSSGNRHRHPVTDRRVRAVQNVCQ